MCASAGMQTCGARCVVRHGTAGSAGVRVVVCSGGLRARSEQSTTQRQQDHQQVSSSGPGAFHQRAPRGPPPYLGFARTANDFFYLVLVSLTKPHLQTLPTTPPRGHWGSIARPESRGLRQHVAPAPAGTTSAGASLPRPEATRGAGRAQAPAA